MFAKYFIKNLQARPGGSFLGISKFLLLFLLSLFVHCPFSLNWDAAGLKCDENKECAESYSCLELPGEGAKCIADHSLELSKDCLYDVQCKSQFCAPQIFKCAVACQNFYAVEECKGDGEYCQPLSIDTKNTSFQGACLTNFADRGYINCNQDSDCSGSKKCVSLSSNKRLCLEPCTITWKTDGTLQSYSCPQGSAGTQLCVPLGPNGTLVCTDALLSTNQPNNVVQPGEACSVVGKPCDTGQACSVEVDGTRICRKYCRLQTTPNPCGSLSCVALDQRAGVATEAGFCR